ncbi:MAG: hypothetical protein RLN90_15135 [Balneolaceae bacterium]
MNTQVKFSTHFIRIGIGTVLILLIPLIAMQFSDEVNWDLIDFIVAGILLSGAGSGFILLSKVSDQIMYRIALGIALVSALLLVRVNGAVGLIGSENNDFNMLYFGVVFILIVGAFISRFRSKGMSTALFATAVAQTSTVFIAIFTGQHHSSGSSVMEVILVNLLFITLFSISSGLFWCVDVE